ncbi:3-deoxy-D-manno-octulosonic acid transferase [Salinihabitans flavidus]|nr:3-deoxy-D-manno-octulosonic acid transferase [Salinihabitans flavidus]
MTALSAPIIQRVVRRKLSAAGVPPGRIAERFGQPTAPRPAGRLVWFHAVSVGEFLSTLGVIETLRESDPALGILVTTTTATAAGMARKRLPSGCVHQFSPLDTPGATRRFLAHWRPDLAVFVESEIWPRQIVSVHRAGIPLALINARLSAGSLRRWSRVPRTARALLSRFACVLCQTDTTRDAVIGLGLPSERAVTTGDLKASSDPLPLDEEEAARLAPSLARRPLWVAASTHPEEEEIVSAAHRRFTERYPDALLILAPRHPDRADVIEAALVAEGWAVARRSAGDAITGETQIYLADTLGEMGLWYHLAPIVLVAGSFVPVGGHNPYEPAHFSCAILHGPLVANFARAYADMDGQWAAREVGNATDLSEQLISLQDSADLVTLQQAAHGFATAAGSARTDAAAALRKLLN